MYSLAHTFVEGWISPPVKPISGFPPKGSDFSFTQLTAPDLTRPRYIHDSGQLVRITDCMVN
jgi:hypothetical protein